MKHVSGQTRQSVREGGAQAVRSSVLLLTGVPASGKTTVICRLAAALQDWRLGGFYTAEIRSSGGERLGFRISTFDGQEEVMAHTHFSGPLRVGKYGVDVGAIGRIAESALVLSPGVDAYLVDEVGRMECLCPIFVARVGALLASGKPVVATVAQHGGGFIEQVRACRGVCEGRTFG
ncbi:nucleoside-triphosphatase [Burkholderia sp. MR1-5-21]